MLQSKATEGGVVVVGGVGLVVLGICNLDLS